MGNYSLGKDNQGKPFEEKKYYTHIKTGRIIQLFRDAAGFREVENGKNINIFPYKSEGKNYRIATAEDFTYAISESNKKINWLQKGLETLSTDKQERPDFSKLRKAAMDGEI